MFGMWAACSGVLPPSDVLRLVGAAVGDDDGVFHTLVVTRRAGGVSPLMTWRKDMRPVIRGLTPPARLSHHQHVHAGHRLQQPVEHRLAEPAACTTAGASGP